MDQGHTGYWYQDGNDAAHSNPEYAFGEYNGMLDGQVTGMQYETAAGGYGGHPSQLSSGQYDPGQFSIDNDHVPARSQHIYHGGPAQSPSHAYIQPSNGTGPQQPMNQQRQFNPAYHHQYDEASQRQPQQPLYDGQGPNAANHFQTHGQNGFSQGQSSVYPGPSQSQGQYSQQPPQHAMQPQYQQSVPQSISQNMASASPQSARHTPVQYSGYPDPNTPRNSKIAPKPQTIQNHSSPQPQTAQFMPPYGGPNPNFPPNGQPVQSYNGKQSPGPATQQQPYQNPSQPSPAGTYVANGYAIDPQSQQQAGQTIGRSQGHASAAAQVPYQAAIGSIHPAGSPQAKGSQVPYFQPYTSPQQVQPQNHHQMVQDNRAIAPNTADTVPGSQAYNTIQPHGQVYPQPQPSAPVVFQIVPNHPHLSVSSAPVRYRAKAGRPQAQFTPLEHTFQTEPQSKPKTGAKRKVSAANATGGSSDSESDEEEEESELDREACKIMVKLGVPKNTAEAVEQEVVSRVWHDRNTVYDKDRTSKTIQWFGTFVDGLWVEVKKLKDDLKAAEESGDKDKISSIQAAARHQNELMHAAIQTADKFGEDYLVSNMGGNRKLCTIMRNALANCFTSKDFTGPYPRVLLKLMSRFTTIDTEFLAKLKLDTLRTKYGEHIDSEMHGYIDQILKNAKLRDEKTKSTEPHKDIKKVSAAAKPVSADPVKKASATGTREAGAVSKTQPIKKEVDAKKPVPEIKKIDYSGLGSARKVSNGAAKAGLNGSPTKRPRDEDADARTSKKVAVEGSSGVPTMKPPGTSTSTSLSQPSQPATAAVKPKLSASILPGKSRTVAKPPVAKRPEPAASSAFSSISGLLAEIAKPKEAPKAREEPERAPETPEEMARRLRKEKRRKLRVMWKPDDQLEEVRIFQHDAAEDEGRAHNMVRDARDNRSEGQMLKLGIQDEDDDAEEDGKPRETNLKDWVVPNYIDFAGIDHAQRDKSFVSRGGVKDITSEQQKFMEEYESRELMAVYTTMAEIPETPRSPPQKALSEESLAPRVGVLPSDTAKMQEIHRRWAEFGQFGPVASQQLALQRLGLDPSGSNKQPAGQERSSSMSSFTTRLMTQEERNEAILTLLKSDAVKNWVDPEPYDHANPRTQRRFDYADSKTQEAADAIEAICEKYRGKPFPPTEPPEHITSPDRSREWWAGHERDLAAKAIRDAKERAKSLAEEQARNAAAAQAAQQAQAQAQAAAQSSIPTNGNDMAAWAAYFAQAQGQGQQAQAQDPAYAAILQQVQALQGGQQQAAQAPQAAAANDIQSLLTTLGGQTASANQAQVADPAAAAWAAYYQNQAQVQGQTDQHAAWAAYYAQYGAQAQANSNDGTDHSSGSHLHQQQQQQQHDDDRGSRQDHHQRDRGSRHHGNRGGGGGGGQGGGGAGAGRDHRGINRALIGTKPCSFWAKGQCAKGDQCTFRHDPNDLK